MTDQPKTPLPISSDDALGWQRTPGVPVYGSGDQCPPPDLDVPINLQSAQQSIPVPPGPQPSWQQAQAPGPGAQQPPYQQQQMIPPAQQQFQPQPPPQAVVAPPPAYDFPWPSPIGPAQSPGERAKALGLDWPDDSSSKPEPPSQ
jgi:hypothetical protein